MEIFSEGVWRKPMLNGPEGMYTSIYRIKPNSQKKINAPKLNLRESLQSLLTYWESCRDEYKKKPNMQKEACELQMIISELKTAISKGWTILKYGGGF